MGNQVETQPTGRIMSRSCTCGGNNENCMFCYGTGTIQGMRSFSSVPAYPIHRQKCPACGCSVTKLLRHLKKAHPEYLAPQNKVRAHALPLAGGSSDHITGAAVSDTQVNQPDTTPGSTLHQTKTADTVTALGQSKTVLKQHPTKPNRVQICPACGSQATDLLRHYSEEHNRRYLRPVSTERSASGRHSGDSASFTGSSPSEHLSGSDFFQIPSESAQNCGDTCDREQARPPSIAHYSPADSQPKATRPLAISGIGPGISTCCPHCGTHLKRKNLERHLGTKCPQNPSASSRKAAISAQKAIRLIRLKKTKGKSQGGKKKPRRVAKKRRPGIRLVQGGLCNGR